MRIVALLAAALVLSAAVPAGAISTDDPFPVGACVRATAVDRRPVCVMVDPDI